MSELFKGLWLLVARLAGKPGARAPDANVGANGEASISPRPSQEHATPSLLEQLACKSAPALRDTQLWLHRRVERISYSERLMIRRRVSVDFTIPVGLPPYAEMPDGRCVFFVPIALVRKWPPVMMWDFRDDSDDPLPFLTSKKNARVDAEALLGLVPEGELRECVRPMLLAIPQSATAADAYASLQSMTTILAAHVPDMSVEELRAWIRVVWVAGTMVGNSVVWARTKGHVGERHIVKFEFQEPVERDLVLRRRVISAFSWGAIRVFLNLPNLGERGSYHLEMTPPPGLEISTVHPLSLSALPPDRWRPAGTRPPAWLRSVRVPYTVARQLARGVRAKWRHAFSAGGDAAGEPASFLLKPTEGQPYYWNAREKAYLYVETTQNQFGIARIDMAVSRSVLIRPALLVSSIIAAFLTVATARSQPMIAEVAPSVTLLLLVPGFLGFLAIRPGEHPLVSRHLVGVTLLLVLATALPAIAAFVLVIAHRVTKHGLYANEHTIHLWWRALSWVSWAIAFALLCSWLLPVPEQREDPAV